MGGGSEVNIIRCVKWDDYYSRGKEGYVFDGVRVCL